MTPLEQKALEDELRALRLEADERRDARVQRLEDWREEVDDFIITFKARHAFMTAAIAFLFGIAGALVQKYILR